MTAFLFGVLVLGTLATRLVGIDYGLPHRIEPDAEVGLQVEYLRKERPRDALVSAYATYPPAIAHLTVAILPAPPKTREVGAVSQEEHRRIASTNLLQARIVVAFLAALLVPGTFLLARRFLPRGWAICAAAWSAFSLIGAIFATQARPHAPAAALVPWVLLACLRLRERGDLGSWMVAGALTGLALGTLQSAVALLIPVVAAHALRDGRRWLEPRAVAGLGLVAISAVVFFPGVFGDLAQDTGNELVHMDGSWLSFGNHRIDLDRFGGRGLAAVVRTLVWYEPGLLAVLVLAAAMWIARGPRVPTRPTGVVLSYVLPYLAVLCLFDDTYERFVLPLVAPLACFAAWGGCELARRIGPAGAALAAFPLLLGLVSTSRLAVLHTRDDTLDEAATWVRANIATDEPIYLSPVPNYQLKSSSLDLPLMRTEATLRGIGGAHLASYNLWTTYQARLSMNAAPEPRHTIRWHVALARDIDFQRGTTPLEHFRANPQDFFRNSGPGVFVIEDHSARPEYATHNLLREALDRFGERLARFEPDGTGFPLGHQDRDREGGDWPNVTWRVLTARTTGPVVEVWRTDHAHFDR